MCHGEEVGRGPWGRDLGPIRFLRVFIGVEEGKNLLKGDTEFLRIRGERPRLV